MAIKSSTHGPSRDSQQAMHENDAHQADHDPGEAAVVPGAEQGGHSHSHAAHLHSEGQESTRPAGDLRQGAAPGARREPPQGQGRTS